MGIVKTNKMVAYYKLIVQHSDNPSLSKVCYVDSKNISLGRSENAENGILLSGPKISKLHAKIIYLSEEGTKEGFYVKNCSKNDIIIHGQRLTHNCKPLLLETKTLIQISNYLIYYLRPSNNLEYSKVDYSASKHLDRLADPLTELNPKVDYVKIDYFLNHKANRRQTVNLGGDFVHPKLITDKVFEVFFEAFQHFGFGKWNEIDQYMQQRNTNLEKKEYKSLALLLLNEYTRISYLKGEMNNCKKLACILRRELQSSQYLQDKYLVGKVQNFVSNNKIDCEQISIKYFVNKIVQHLTEKEFKAMGLPKSQLESWTVNHDYLLVEHISLFGLDNLVDLEKDSSIVDFWGKRNDSFSDPSQKLEFYRGRINALVDYLEQMADPFNKKNSENSKWSLVEHFLFLKMLQCYGFVKNFEAYKSNFKKLFDMKSEEEVKKRFESFNKAIFNILANRNKNTKENEFKLTFDGAKRMKERFSLFKTLRSLLSEQNHSRLKEVLQNYNSPNKIEMFELDLLKGVSKYGLSNWDKIKSDKDLVFHTLSPGALKNLPASFLILVTSYTKFLVTELSKSPLSLNSKYSKSKPLDGNLPEKETHHGLKKQTLEGERQSGTGFRETKFGNRKRPKTVSSQRDIDGTSRIHQTLEKKFVLLDIGSPNPLNSNSPIGYKSMIKHTSCVDPTSSCKYVNEIRVKNNKTVYSVTCEDDRSSPIYSLNPTEIWREINERIKKICPEKGLYGEICGFEIFGLKNGKIRELIMKLNQSSVTSTFPRLPNDLKIVLPQQKGDDQFYDFRGF